jgi:hypothetical protein
MPLCIWTLLSSLGESGHFSIGCYEVPGSKGLASDRAGDFDLETVLQFNVLRCGSTAVQGAAVQGAAVSTSNLEP